MYLCMYPCMLCTVSLYAVCYGTTVPIYSVYSSIPTVAMYGCMHASYGVTVGSRDVYPHT